MTKLGRGSFILMINAVGASAGEFAAHQLYIEWGIDDRPHVTFLQMATACVGSRADYDLENCP